jgi:hypothetical protein
VLLDKRSILFPGLAACLLSLLASCANSPTGKELERSLSADSKLKDNTSIFGGSTQKTPQKQSDSQPPKDFPTEIPLYPQAELKKVEALTVPNSQGQLTTWSSPDPINAIQSYYQKAFESGNWQIVSKPEADDGGTFVVRKNDLQVTLSIPSSDAVSNSKETATATPNLAKTSSSSTQFDIQYIRNSSETAASPSDKKETTKPTASPTVESSPTTTASATSQNFSDIDKVPQQWRQNIQDLANLGILTLNESGNNSKFEPNKTITRREFARWLVAANNRIFANRPGQQIRLASESSQPAFQDVPKNNPDFPSIQALAEAGLIPSPLTGDSTAVLFRPDAPLTRENLVLWKVPLDTRQALPTASLDAVKQTWGFQDIGKIDPKALRAVLADFQNGEQGNIRRIFGYTTLFQPKKAVTRAEAAAAIWYFGSQGEGLSAKEAQQLKSQKSQPSATPESSPASSPN